MFSFFNQNLSFWAAASTTEKRKKKQEASFRKGLVSSNDINPWAFVFTETKTLECTIINDLSTNQMEVSMIIGSELSHLYMDSHI